jgi:hypothetical protein
MKFIPRWAERKFRWEVALPYLVLVLSIFVPLGQSLKSPSLMSWGLAIPFSIRFSPYISGRETNPDGSRRKRYEILDDSGAWHSLDFDRKLETFATGPHYRKLNYYHLSEIDLIKRPLQREWYCDGDLAKFLQIRVKKVRIWTHSARGPLQLEVSCENE